MASVSFSKKPLVKDSEVLRYDIFIVHDTKSKEDDAFCSGLVQLLTKSGYRVCSFQPGQFVIRTFFKYLRESKIAIFLLSTNLSKCSLLQMYINGVLEKKTPLLCLATDDVTIPDDLKNADTVKVVRERDLWQSNLTFELDVLVKPKTPQASILHRLWNNVKFLLRKVFVSTLKYFAYKSLTNGINFFCSQFGIQFLTTICTGACGLIIENKEAILDLTKLKIVAKSENAIIQCLQANLSGTEKYFSIDINPDEPIPTKLSDPAAIFIRKLSQLTLKPPVDQGKKVDYYPACYITGPKMDLRNQETIKNFVRDAMVEKKVDTVAFPEMVSYEKRLESLKSWPKNKTQTPEEIARAGFFTREELPDHTQCFHCGGIIANWMANADPILRHAKWFYSCPYVQTLISQAEIEKCRLQLKIDTPVYNEKYTAETDRLKSYRTTAGDQNYFSPEDLSKAGFYFTGLDDNVGCFQCGLILSLRSMCKERDLFYTHALENAECTFLERVKGKQFAVDIHNTLKPAFRENSKRRITFFIKFKSENQTCRNIHLL